MNQIEPIADGTPYMTCMGNHARHDSAEDFCRLKARRCRAMSWIFIPAY